MAKIKLATDERKDIFLYKTEVENLFINEFLPEAPGEYVKVFLFGLMYAQYDQVMDSAKISMDLGLSEDEIEEAWIYWESRGLVKFRTEKTEDGDIFRRVIFISQIESLYGKASEEPESTGPAAEEPDAEPAETAESEIPHFVSIDDMEFDAMFDSKVRDEKLRGLYRKYQDVTGRPVSRRETGKIEDAIKVYGIEPEIFDFSIDYCADLEKFSIDYIFKVALRWTEEGCKTVEEAKRLLEKHSLRNAWYTKVFKELGFSRLPAPADREIMDRWFDEMGCSIDEVLDACRASAGIREPNLRYVNKVLENRRLEKGGIKTAPAEKTGRDQQTVPVSDGGSPVSRKVLADYYEHLRSKAEEDRKERIEETLRKVPEMKRVLEAEIAINSKLMSLRPGAAGSDERQMLKAERFRIEDRKKALLEAAGLPADHMDKKYRCSICRDTGYTDDGMVCSCARERAEEAFGWIGDRKKS